MKKVILLTAALLLASILIFNACKNHWSESSGTTSAGYTVTFNSNGGSVVSPITGAAHGSKITAPTEPTKSGYDCKFDGWYKDFGLTTIWNFSIDTVTSNTILYAKWSEYNIGETGPGGGKIFFKDKTTYPSGFTVEMVSPTPNYTAYYLEYGTGRTLEWGAYGTFISGVTTFTSTSDPLTNKIGNGRKDTQLIVTHLATIPETDRAAQWCIEYTGGGKSDWFLPSYGELKELQKSNLLSYNEDYMSSSQYDAQKAWSKHISMPGARIGDKNETIDEFRAIRAF